MTAHPSTPSLWRPSFRAHCDRRNYLKGYGVIAILCWISLLVSLCAAAFRDLFIAIGINADIVFGPIMVLAMISWVPLVIIAGYLYLPALVIRRARSISPVSAVVCITAILAVAWLQTPQAELRVGKTPLEIALQVMVDPWVILSTLFLFLPRTRARVQESVQGGIEA